MKKLLSFAASCVFGLGLISAQTENSTSKDLKVTSGGKVLNIYCWNDEFMSIMSEYYPAYDSATQMIGDVQVNWILKPNMNSMYLKNLEEELAAQKNTAPDERVDIFITEPDYATKFIESKYTADLKSQIGLSEKDIANQFAYTKNLYTDSEGALKGVTWQAFPNVMIYRRSIAKDLFGSDEPELVQKKLSNWKNFENVAELAKQKGYRMVSGYDDTFRTFTSDAKNKWVQNGKITVDKTYDAWIQQTKDFSDKGYTNKTNLWSAEWMQDMQRNSSVFCYFAPEWFIDYVLALSFDPESKNTDWAVCKGPQSSFWGGTWISAAAGTDNADIVKDILLKLTCDTENMQKIALGNKTFVNNERAMNAVGSDKRFNREILGGQNPSKIFITVAKSIKQSKLGLHDEELNNILISAMRFYFNGTKSLESAWQQFYDDARQSFRN
ncbi:carbohydrate ABC transporter substrate-binding protein [Treponema zioleckii]|uniref:carbohydrate ABC transporter substrate-binding protein n=1 Tax=Treponema zioleckii TaxID=331680 RepID=UPI00168B01E2|nr:carbohydrate ABC transporter substrate-binding protein [Treponema zioleckii]